MISVHIYAPLYMISVHIYVPLYMISVHIYVPLYMISVHIYVPLYMISVHIYVPLYMISVHIYVPLYMISVHIYVPLYMISVHIYVPLYMISVHIYGVSLHSISWVTNQQTQHHLQSINWPICVHSPNLLHFACPVSGTLLSNTGVFKLGLQLIQLVCQCLHAWLNGKQRLAIEKRCTKWCQKVGWVCRPCTANKNSMCLDIAHGSQQCTKKKMLC